MTHHPNRKRAERATDALADELLTELERRASEPWLPGDLPYGLEHRRQVPLDLSSSRSDALLEQGLTPPSAWPDDVLAHVRRIEDEYLARTLRGPSTVTGPSRTVTPTPSTPHPPTPEP